jgi:peptidoglycan/LPS O-acetylase OafA/YrhL
MNRPFSVYLDLVRFIAAVLVYVWHSNQRFLTEAILPFSGYGHSSVIVFFVLSGFIIAYITDTKDSTLADYAASRISRVFSVAIPAIVITLILDSIGRNFYPAIYDYPYDQFLTRIGGSLLMANEVWLISITSFSNVPYWSICYEWWYYVTFAMVMFFPMPLGWVLAAITMVMIGPKVALLAPIWWFGVLLYRWERLRRISRGLSWTMVVCSLVGIYWFHHVNMMSTGEAWLESLIGNDLVYQLTFSKRVLADYLLGILVLINFAGMRNVVTTHGVLLNAMARPVRFLANYTFTLYLIHQPLFLFWAAVIRGDPRTLWYWSGVSLLTMLSVGAIGFITENRRHVLRGWMLPAFRRWEAGMQAGRTRKVGVKALSSKGTD